MCFQFRTPLCVLLNIALSVTIVILNKSVYLNVGFPNVTLTLFHFVMTSIGLFVCRSFKLFTTKQLPIKNLVPLALSFCGFVVFTNLSLQFNTVGTYQVLKTLTMPVIVVIMKFMYDKTLPLKVQLSLVPMCIGVIMNSAYDIKFDVLGTLYALIGVVITSFYQVWVGEKQREMDVNSMQLLYYLAPMSSLSLMVCIPFIEPPWSSDGIFFKGITSSHLILIFASGIVAFSINISIYWLIGNTSAVSYNVVGQLKFCITLLGGYLVFREPIMPIQFLGIVVTFFGVSAYAYLKYEEQRKMFLPRYLGNK